MGDKRRYLTGLVVPSFPDLEEFARQKGLPTEDREALIREPLVRGLFQGAVDQVNAHLARYETLKKFEILPVEFSQETGELTPTLKVKRKVVAAKYTDKIAAMYEDNQEP